MEQTLEIVSVNIWQILISLANLTILYLLLKKFLYKPVKAVIEGRKASIAKDYADAESARSAANAARDEYAAKLATAHTEADEIIHEATVMANKRGDKIVAEAHQKADEIVRQGELEASMEKKKAMETIRQDITDVSAAMTEKLLGREMNTADHRSMIDEFLKGVGEGK
ncbi:MAG: F0F1 ATP synthase subunit B [Clostridiales bacterium]|nr:F0F1 ATP synthase subunit B [Clostridiales bacterium]